jgi:hypothetical protein
LERKMASINRNVLNYLIITQSTQQFISWKINTRLSHYFTFFDDMFRTKMSIFRSSFA